LCPWHSPDFAERRAESSRQGGRNSSNRNRAKKQLPAEAMGPEELQAYLALVFKAVLSGKLAPNIGNCLGTLARSMVQVREASEMEERMSRVEEALESNVNRKLI
jgi:hypothetical protein